MTITIRINDDDAKLIKEYANFNKVSVSEMMRSATLEKIEDEIDLAAYIHAKGEMERGELQFASFDEAWEQMNERD